MATRTTTKAAAKPAARTTTRSKPAAAKVADEPDLLAGLDEAAPAEDESEEGLDLLAGITEDNGTAWVPFDDDDQPRGIQGIVTYVGSVGSDYSDEDVPLIELTDSGDPSVTWSIRGYATALRNQIQKCDPQVGDLFAVKYLGETKSKKRDKDYHDFKAAVKHNN